MKVRSGFVSNSSSSSFIFHGVELTYSECTLYFGRKESEYEYEVDERIEKFLKELGVEHPLALTDYNAEKTYVGTGYKDKNYLTPKQLKEISKQLPAKFKKFFKNREIVIKLGEAER